jgi:LysM repeat protein
MDYKQGYDMNHWRTLWKILKCYAVPSNTIKQFEMLSSNAEIKIKYKIVLEFRIQSTLQMLGNDAGFNLLLFTYCRNKTLEDT